MMTATSLVSRIHADPFIQPEKKPMINTELLFAHTINDLFIQSFGAVPGSSANDRSTTRLHELNDSFRRLLRHFFVIISHKNLHKTIVLKSHFNQRSTGLSTFGVK